MARIQLPLHSYEHRSKPASSSRLQNCYIEQLPPDAKSPVVLARAPGIQSFITLAKTPIQAMLGTPEGLADKGTVDSLTGVELWAVAGGFVYAISEDATAEQIGFFDNGQAVGENVDLGYNIDSIVVVNQPDLYVRNFSISGFVKEASAAYTDRGASHVEFLDNYLLFVEPNTGRFFSADLGSNTSFDALFFATAESNPDLLIGMLVDHEQLLLFGREVTEIWEHTGISGFPFERAIAGVVQQGCAAGKSPARVDQTVFWLADDLTVRNLQGVTPVRVSTHGVEQAISLLTTSTATSFGYTQDGHLFYVLSLDGQTFVFDVTTGLWHERITYGKPQWNAKFHAFAYGKNFVGDFETGRIGILDADTYDEFGTTQVMSWTYQTIYAEGARAFHDRLEIIMETGVGLTSGQGSDPQIMLEFSDDGGITYTSLPDKDIGKIGERQHRVIWSALGSAEQRNYRASVSDPVSVSVTDTILTVRGGRL